MVQARLGLWWSSQQKREGLARTMLTHSEERIESFYARVRVGLVSDDHHS